MDSDSDFSFAIITLHPFPLSIVEYLSVFAIAFSNCLLNFQSHNERRKLCECERDLLWYPFRKENLCTVWWAQKNTRENNTAGLPNCRLKEAISKSHTFCDNNKSTSDRRHCVELDFWPLFSYYCGFVHLFWSCCSKLLKFVWDI